MMKTQRRHHWLLTWTADDPVPRYVLCWCDIGEDHDNDGNLDNEAEA